MAASAAEAEWFQQSAKVEGSFQAESEKVENLQKIKELLGETPVSKFIFELKTKGHISQANY